MMIFGLLTCALIPILIISILSYNTAEAELKSQLIRQLESVRNIKRDQVVRFFNERIRDTAAISRNPHTVEAFKALKSAFNSAKKLDDASFKGMMKGRYRAPDAYRYIHDRYNGYFKDLINIYGYYDLFFLSRENGDIFYTVKKESDFATRISQIRSPLRKIWRKTVQSGRPAISDTELYMPSIHIPAQFISFPIYSNRKILGVLAIQVTIESIDEIMKERSGLWQTAETYLVGPDFKMRSDSFLDPNNHSVHASLHGSVEENGADGFAVRNALKGVSGHTIGNNYLGRKTISSYAPVHIRSLKWALLAEVSYAELKSLIRHQLAPKLLTTLLLTIVLLLLLSLLVAQFITAGFRQTVNHINRLIRDVIDGNFDRKQRFESVQPDFQALLKSADQLIDAFISQWEKRDKLEKQTMTAHKMEAIGTLAGGIAHDFNNLLASLYTLSYIVLSELPEDSASRTHMEELNSVLERASRLVDQILAFGRQENDESLTAEVTSTLNNHIEILKSTLPKYIQVRSEITKEPMHINISPAQLNQIVMNLTANAIYAIDRPDGKIEIEVEKVLEADPRSDTGTRSAYCHIRIRDNGTGIPESIQTKIFDPYFTTKQSGEGSGIGLSITRGIVVNSGGWIQCQSKMGQGSSFHLYFPLVEAVAVPSETEKKMLPVKGSGQRIMFVDDERMLCSSLTKILKKWGYDCYGFTKASVALASFNSNPEGFDLVISDYNMPEMNGIDLIRKLKEIRPDIPVIMTSGLTDLRYDSTLQKTGIHSFIKKPFRSRKLRETIHNALTEKSDDTDPGGKSGGSPNWQRNN